jgi:site-specific recombinase XerD
MLIYSAGLRVSEVVKLRIEDIDSKRELVCIKGAKGRKDRYTLLSKATLETLKKYGKEYNPSKCYSQVPIGKGILLSELSSEFLRKLVKMQGLENHLVFIA